MSIETVIKSNSFFTSSRITSLYSDFSDLKITNPEGYEANINAWKSLLNQLIEDGIFNHTVLIDSSKLEEALTLPRVGKPLGLGEVLDVLVQRDILLPYSSYRSRKTSIHKNSWISITGTLTWCIKQTGLMNFDHQSRYRNGSLKQEQYISLTKVQAFCEQVVGRIEEQDHGYSSRIYTKSEFFSLIEANFGKTTPLDLQIILIYLFRDMNQCAVEDDTIKFRARSLDKKENLLNEKPLIISEEDKSIAQLKSTIDSINLRNLELNDKIDHTNLKIRECLIKNQKEQAKVYLKTRKIFNSSLETSLSSLNNLITVLVKIDDASTNIDTVETLSRSSDLLQKLNASIDFGKLYHLMQDIEENIANVDKVSDELLLFKSDINEDDIDNELNEIFSQETDKNAKEKEKNQSESIKSEKDKEEDVLLERLNRLRVESPASEKDTKISTKSEREEAITN